MSAETRDIGDGVSQINLVNPTVAELIEVLAKLPPDMPIEVFDPEWCDYGTEFTVFATKDGKLTIHNWKMDF